jgi:hypothetical protein
MPSKTGVETVPVHSNDYFPCLESALGLSADALVEGPICLNFLNLHKNRCEVNKTAWEDFKINYKLEDLLEIDPRTFMMRAGGRKHYYVKLGSTSGASRCMASMKADPDLKIPRRLGSQTKRREFQSALNELVLKEWDDERLESWLIGADVLDGKEKEDGDSRDDDGEKDDNNNHSADGVAQGVSSDLTGDTRERTNVDPEGWSNPERRKELHPVVTGSSFHRIGAVAEKEEYPWFHEFGIPVDNYATIYGMFRDIQKRLG